MADERFSVKNKSSIAVPAVAQRRRRQVHNVKNKFSIAVPEVAQRRRKQVNTVKNKFTIAVPEVVQRRRRRQIWSPLEKRLREEKGYPER